ncbi:MAG: response regulator [Desulfobacterales bacterium]
MNHIDQEHRDSFLILVVDDEEPIRDMVLQCLKQAGFRCISARDGKEALALMEQNPVDVVITDISMPRMDGIELTQNIKGKFDAEIIVMTGFVKDFSYENVIAQGASDFIQKPVILEELELRLNRLLRQRVILAERNQVEKENKQTLERLRKTISGIIYAMAMTIEIRDPHTAGHQRRVANLSRALGKELCLSATQIEGLGMAGVIHDLGKISIPSEILSKPGKLNDLEYAMMKTHPQVGYDILKSIDFPWPLAEIILQHHEKLDGSGYPQGLKEDQIIFEAKILAVADTVEAMASHRPHRNSNHIDFVLEQISGQRGVAYDPQVVDACLYLFKEKSYKF